MTPYNNSIARRRATPQRRAHDSERPNKELAVDDFDVAAVDKGAYEALSVNA